VNLFLVPYTWMRHGQVALVTAGAALMAWALLLGWMVVLGPFWPLSWDGAFLVLVLASSVGGASTLAEANLRRMHPAWRLGRTLLSAAISGAFALGWYWLWTKWSGPLLLPDAFEDDIADPTFVSLRVRVGAFAMAGFSTAAGPLIVRKGAGLFDHLIAGLAAGLAGGAAWHLANFTAWYDLYLSGAACALAWGGTFGLLAWGIPNELYNGWLRVLSPHRYSYRIPVDALDRSPKERFVGHFPRGLDLWLGNEDGCAELHISMAVDEKQVYRVRGLSLQPTMVCRFLERIDLRYDPRRPAPLETQLASGDRIVVGQGQASATFEFIMLPREEK